MYLRTIVITIRVICDIIDFFVLLMFFLWNIKYYKLCHGYTCCFRHATSIDKTIKLHDLSNHEANRNKKNYTFVYPEHF